MTYGHGLVDCVREDGMGPLTVPSKIAWPDHLAKLLDKQCVNKSTPGAGNLEILHHILNFKFIEGDTAVILWSYPSRDMVFNALTEGYPFPYTPVGVWMNSPLARSWMETHSDHDLGVRSCMYIHHAEQYLENIKIINHSFFVNFYQIELYKPKYLTFKNTNPAVIFGESETWDDFALDKSHPGPVSHIRAASRIYTQISLTNDK